MSKQSHPHSCAASAAAPMSPMPRAMAGRRCASGQTRAPPSWSSSFLASRISAPISASAAMTACSVALFDKEVSGFIETTLDVVVPYTNQPAVPSAAMLISSDPAPALDATALQRRTLRVLDWGRDRVTHSLPNERHV